MKLVFIAATHSSALIGPGNPCDLTDQAGHDQRLSDVTDLSDDEIVANSVAFCLQQLDKLLKVQAAKENAEQRFVRLPFLDELLQWHYNQEHWQYPDLTAVYTAARS